jgi:UDP-3-O-[3-hydroxymyristoyl] glucosamine N-acyltransferase
MADSDFFNKIGKLSLEEIAKVSGAEIHLALDRNQAFAGVAPIDSASADEVTFLSNKKYCDDLAKSTAGACIMSKDTISKAPQNMAILLSDNPYAAYAKLASAFYPVTNYNGKISDKAFISKSSVIGKNCTIEAGAFIGDNAKIGDNCFIASGSYIDKNVKIGSGCIIRSGVTISHSILGDNIILHPGVRLGQDGFGFATDKGVHIKVPQLGRVIIHDDVEIGSNSCVDRGAGPDTIIGKNTKIDNLVQIGHNVQIGKGCIIVSHVGISGSTKLGDYVVVAGQVGIAGHLKIGNMVSIAAQSGVIHDIEDNLKIGGSPAIPIKEWHRQTVAIKKLGKNKGKLND